MKSILKVGIILVLLFTALAVIGAMTYANRPVVSEEGLVREVTVTRHPVQTLVVRPSTLKESLVSTGVLKANQDVVLSSEVAGQVKKVFKELGDRCEKGELLLRLDPEGYQIALAQAKAQVAYWKKQLGQR